MNEREHSRLNPPLVLRSHFPFRLPLSVRGILETAKHDALSDVSEWPRTDHELMAG